MKKKNILLSTIAVALLLVGCSNEPGLEKPDPFVPDDPIEKVDDFTPVKAQFDTEVNELAVGEKLSLIDSLVLYNSSEQTFAIDKLNTDDFSFTFDNKKSGEFSIDKEFNIVAEKVGEATLNFAFKEDVLASFDFTIKTNDEVNALAEKLSLGNSFALEGEVLGGKAIRTPNYYYDGLGEGVLVSSGDGKAYKYKVQEDKIKVSYNVLAEDGAAYIDEVAPSLAFTNSDFSYYESLASSLKEKGIDGYKYFLTGKGLDPILKFVGLDSIFTIGGAQYIVYALAAKVVDEVPNLYPILMDATGNLNLWGTKAWTITDIGTATYDLAQNYVNSGAIPSAATIEKLAEEIQTLSESHNYTITGNATFYESGTKTPLDTSEVETNSTIKDYIDTVKKQRQFIVTPDGILYDYYQTSYTSAGYEHVYTGYLNHQDEDGNFDYLTTFTMKDGKAQIGSKDYDYLTGGDVTEKYWEVYHNGLIKTRFDADTLKNAQFEDKGDYFYYDSHNDNSNFMLDMLHVAYTDVEEVLTSNGASPFVAGNIIMTYTPSESIILEITIPTYFDDDHQGDLAITLTYDQFGTSVIPGLSDILKAEPTSGGSGGGGWWDW